MTIEATRQQTRIVIAIAQLRGTDGWYGQGVNPPSANPPRHEWRLDGGMNGLPLADVELTAVPAGGWLDLVASLPSLWRGPDVFQAFTRCVGSSPRYRSGNRPAV
jgi:hypothetical protein